MATPTSLLSPSPPLSLLKPIKPTNKPNPFPQNSILTKPIKNYSEIHKIITKKAILGAGFGLITLVGPAYAADVALLGQLSEPANALSLPTWAIHVSSVVEWITAMVLVWQYGEKSGYESWKGLSWGMVPLLGGAFCACTWYFFYNSEDLEVLPLTTMADWAKLIPDILFMVANQIEVVEDFVSFSSVCSTWRYVTLRKGSARSLQPHQSIMFYQSPKGFPHKIYSFTRDKFCILSLPVDMMEKKLTYTHGWILMDSQGPEISLIHPFSHHVISLPPKTDFHTSAHFSHHLTKKAVLSCSPSFFPDDFILMVIYYYFPPHKLCFWKPGDRKWTMLEETYDTMFDDITYYRGKFYAVNVKGLIYVCDVRSCNPTVMVPIGKIPIECSTVLYYFARKTGSHSSFLIVARFRYIFRVYELDLNGKGGVEEVNDLKGRTLFLSYFHDSICCRHSKFPPGIILVDDIDIHDFQCLKSCRSKDCPVTRRLYKRAMSMNIYHLKGEIMTYFCCSL